MKHSLLNIIIWHIYHTIGSILLTIIQRCVRISKVRKKVVVIMKEVFTVKEIMDGTGVSRQRVHALIKNRGIPVHTDKNKLIVKWDDLLKLSDNASIVQFLKVTLEKERQLLEKVHDYQEENNKVIRYAKAIEYAHILLEGLPAKTPEGQPLYTEENREKWNLWNKASIFFSDLIADINVES